MAPRRDTAFTRTGTTRQQEQHWPQFPGEAPPATQHPWHQTPARGTPAALSRAPRPCAHRHLRTTTPASSLSGGVHAVPWCWTSQKRAVGTTTQGQGWLWRPSSAGTVLILRSPCLRSVPREHFWTQELQGEQVKGSPSTVLQHPEVGTQGTHLLTFWPGPSVHRCS